MPVATEKSAAFRSDVTAPAFTTSKATPGTGKQKQNQNKTEQKPGQAVSGAIRVPLTGRLSGAPGSSQGHLVPNRAQGSIPWRPSEACLEGYWGAETVAAAVYSSHSFPGMLFSIARSVFEALSGWEVVPPSSSLMFSSCLGGYWVRPLLAQSQDSKIQVLKGSRPCPLSI